MSNTPVLRFLHIAVLVAMAIAQPIYSLLSGYPEFFIARFTEPQELLALVGVLSAGIPLLIWFAWWPFRLLSAQLGNVLLAAVIGLLVGCLTLQVLGSATNMVGDSQVVLSAILAAGFAIVYLRVQNFGRLLTVLSPVIILFPALFLLFSPVARVFLPASGAVPGEKIDSDIPVVFIVFDELPTTTLMAQDGTIDAQAFPAFADLARHSTWYRNATTVAAGTLNAIPAIVTGRDPVHTHIPSALDYPESIFSMLGHSYHLQVTEPLTQLCHEKLCDKDAQRPFSEKTASLLQDVKIIFLHILLPEDYAQSLPSISENWMGFVSEEEKQETISVDKEGKSDSDIVDEIAKKNAPKIIKTSWQDWDPIYAESLGALQSGSTKFLHFQHVQLPHVPWRYLPSGKRYKDTFVYGKEDRDDWIHEQPALMAQGFQRHLLQVAYVDAMLAKLLRKLRVIGLFDAALIVVTSDHGASFKIGSKRRTPTPENISDLAGVPLFLKLPNQMEGKISDEFVKVIDIVPTIADVLNIKPLWPMDGSSVLSPDYREHSQPGVYSTYGYELVFPTEELAKRSWVLSWKAELFGTDKSIENFFAMGPGRQFVGIPVAELQASSKENFFVELKNPQQYDTVDLSSAFSPARVSGVVSIATQEPAGTILVAVNGTIQGCGEIFSAGGESGKFSVMVPAASFREGANEVAIYYYDGESDDKAKLTKLQRRAMTPP